MTIQTNLNDRKELARKLTITKSFITPERRPLPTKGRASASFAAAISNVTMERQKPP